MQQFFKGLNSLKEIISNNNFSNILVVTSARIANTQFVVDAIKKANVKYDFYTNFTPNPKMEEAKAGLEFYKNGNFDTILAIGGGSALDVAKYIKLHAKTSMIAVPTTAGSGSEATRFAVVYENGEKQSINSLDIIPEFVVFESKFLETLPEYQKKCTVMDALCHSIESYWSVNSTDESKEIAKKAIKLIVDNYQDYINNKKEVNDDIMLASTLAGQAINITQTTAGHALSYKLTSVFGIPHGHAVALCLSKVWDYMNNHIDACCNKRGQEYLSTTLEELSNIISLDEFNKIIKNFDLQAPKIKDKAQLDLFVNSVNVERLGNFPVKLTEQSISKIYSSLGKNKDNEFIDDAPQF